MLRRRLAWNSARASYFDYKTEHGEGEKGKDAKVGEDLKVHGLRCMAWAQQSSASIHEDELEVSDVVDLRVVDLRGIDREVLEFA